MINRFYVKPLLGEDLWALEEEQRAHDLHPHEHHYEFNPIVKAFQKLSLEKWEQYIESEVTREEQFRKENRRNFVPGAGLTRWDLQEYKASQDERFATTEKSRKEAAT